MFKEVTMTTGFELVLEVIAQPKVPPFYQIFCPSKYFQRAVVVAQLANRLLPTPEVRGSNPVIGEVFIEHC